MQNNLKYWKASLVVLCLLIVATAAEAASVAFYVGEVTAIRGGKKLPIKTGVVLQQGDEIMTGEKSTLELTYKDGSKVTILENSAAVVGSNDAKDSDNVALIFGNIRGKFSKLSKDGTSKKVYTPTNICAIRGTEFNITVSRDGSSYIDLTEGNLNIKNHYGEEDITQGEKTETRMSQAPDKTQQQINSEEWLIDKDDELLKSPEKAVSRYRKHIENISSETTEQSEYIQKYGDMVSSVDEKKQLDEIEFGIKNAEEIILDDLISSQTIADSINKLSNEFSGKDEKAFQSFEELKNEVNKVTEQYRTNYKAIKAVKEEHQKAKKKILHRFQDERGRIREGLH